jgi:hypothetical protein
MQKPQSLRQRSADMACVRAPNIKEIETRFGAPASPISPRRPTRRSGSRRMGRPRIVLDSTARSQRDRWGSLPTSSAAATGRGPAMPSLRQIRPATGLVPPRASGGRRSKWTGSKASSLRLLPHANRSPMNRDALASAQPTPLAEDRSSRFSSVHRADFVGQQRVEGGRSPTLERQSQKGGKGLPRRRPVDPLPALYRTLRMCGSPGIDDRRETAQALGAGDYRLPLLGPKTKSVPSLRA